MSSSDTLTGTHELADEIAAVAGQQAAIEARAVAALREMRATAEVAVCPPARPPRRLVVRIDAGSVERAFNAAYRMMRELPATLADLCVAGHGFASHTAVLFEQTAQSRWRADIFDNKGAESCFSDGWDVRAVRRVRMGEDVRDNPSHAVEAADALLREHVDLVRAPEQMRALREVFYAHACNGYWGVMDTRIACPWVGVLLVRMWDMGEGEDVIMHASYVLPDVVWGVEYPAVLGPLCAVVHPEAPRHASPNFAQAARVSVAFAGSLDGTALPLRTARIAEDQAFDGRERDGQLSANGAWSITGVGTQWAAKTVVWENRRGGREEVRPRTWTTSGALLLTDNNAWRELGERMRR